MLAALVAEALGLGAPVRDLVPVQYSDRETWRLETARGAFLVKRLWQAGDTPRWAEVERSMRLERRAIEAGIEAPCPIEPERPAVGWAVTVRAHGCFRAYPWLEHRRYAFSPDLADWVGRTLATLHALAPVEDAGPIDWPWYGVWSEQTWLVRIDDAQRLGKAWASAARQRLPDVMALTDRVRAVYASVPDHVETHGDLEPHNVLLTERGPMLIDWERVMTYSAALQAGRVAYAFGDQTPKQMGRVLDAYARAGGEVAWPGRDVFVSTASHALASLGICVCVALGEQEAPRWLDPADADRYVEERLRRLPGLVRRLDDLAMRVSAV